MNEATGMFTLLLYISLLVHPVIRDSHAGFIAFTGPNSLFNVPIISGIFSVGNFYRAKFVQ